MPDSRIALREYPARFERFFDDRFGLRGKLVDADHWVKAIVFGVSPVSKVLIGKSGWLYFRGEDSKAFDRWYRGNETVPDATLIAASPSTKNGAQKRDPEMRSSKKGNQWYFGMKAHIGVDAKSGLVHTAGVTTGSVHDAKVMDHLIREDDRAV